MKKIIFFILITVPFFPQAQDTGIIFQRGSSWKEIQEKALKENKYIFMDCFTTWCGPCRYMSTTIFPMQRVGEFMNEKFIAVQVQLDTTKTDNDSVKAWYQTGHDIAQEYSVIAYPTYLIFDPNGTIVHRFVGSSPPDLFLAEAKKSLIPDSQYYRLLTRYNEGDRNPAFLRLVVSKAVEAYDLENAEKIGNEYLSSRKNLYTRENLALIKELTNSSRDRGFAIMIHHPSKVDAIMGTGTAASVADPIIIREVVVPYFLQRAKKDPDWRKIDAGLQRKYPGSAAEVLARSKVIWYRQQGKWDQFQYAIVNYMHKYGKSVPDESLNDYAWTVFQNCPDLKCVAEALNWSRQSFKKVATPGYIDTYANLLYKLGKKDEAILWEQKAKNLAVEADQQGYQDVIDKINKNEKTWDN